MNEVIHEGEKYKVIKGALRLVRKRIKSITDIQGLDKLTHLKSLDLEGNEITEISGLEKLTNLEKLNLSMNFISEIKGLEGLIRLEVLNISNHRDAIFILIFYFILGGIIFLIFFILISIGLKKLKKILIKKGEMKRGNTKIL